MFSTSTQLIRLDVDGLMFPHGSRIIGLRLNYMTCYLMAGSGGVGALRPDLPELVYSGLLAFHIH